MIRPLLWLLGSESVQEIVYECSRCGMTVEDEADECPFCGPTRIAAFDVF